jgi:hypothetical protein
MIFMILYYRKVEPLSNRGSIPLFSMFFLLIRDISYSIFHLFSHYDSWYRYNCFFTIAFEYPGSFMLLLFFTAVRDSFLNPFLKLTYRYVLIINLNNSKRLFHENGGKPTLCVRIVRCQKLLTSDLSIIIFVSVFFSVCFVIAFIFIFASIQKVQCIQGEQGLHITLIIFEILFTFLNWVMIILDIVLNFRKFICSPKEFWFKNDPFFIRIQLVVFIVFSSCKLVNNFEVLIASILVHNFPQYEAIELVSDMLVLVYYVFEVITRTFEIFYFAGFLLIIAMFKSFFSKKQKIDFNESFLNDPEMYALIKKKSEEEWSLENIMCYEDVKKFESSSQKERINLMGRIFDLYLKTTSELEVNLPGSTLAELSRNRQALGIGEIPDDFFDLVTKQVLTNIADTYARVLVSPEFYELQSKRKFVEEQKVQQSLF